MHELSYMHSVQTRLYDLKEKFLKEICTNVLNRPVLLSDAQDFSFVHLVNHPDREWIAYKGKVVGEIATNFNAEKYSMEFTFVPGELPNTSDTP